MEQREAWRSGVGGPGVQIIGVTGLPEVEQGASLGRMIVEAATAQGTPVGDGDILIVTQKIVSKAEGRTVDLKQVEPTPAAIRLAAETGKDPRMAELILRESRGVVRKDAARGILIVETDHGFVCANAGIDASNVPGEDAVTLLPLDPDASSLRISEEVARATSGVEAAVIVSDTFGRAWREGQVNFAIGVAGMAPIKDYRGTLDSQGSRLAVTAIAVADELAAAGELVMGKSERVPVALVRGYPYSPSEGGVGALLRDRSTDLFR